MNRLPDRARTSSVLAFRNQKGNSISNPTASVQSSDFIGLIMSNAILCSGPEISLKLWKSIQASFVS